MAWFGTRVYVGASWTAMKAEDGSMTWTEIAVTNPLPVNLALTASFRRADGTPDGRFFAARTLLGLAQTTFLVRDLTVPSLTTGWFVLTSFPTPIVPFAIKYWARGPANQTEVINVPVEQLDADGFPIGDAAAEPPPAEQSPPEPIQSLRRPPPPTDLWAEGLFGSEHAEAGLEFFRAAQSAPGSLDAAEPLAYTVGLLVDDEVEEFRSSFGDLPRLS